MPAPAGRIFPVIAKHIDRGWAYCRHCERSEAIQLPIGQWIASSLAPGMTMGRSRWLNTPRLRSASLLVCTRPRLCSILPSIAPGPFARCAERHDRISCSRRNSRGISCSYSASPFLVMRSRNSRRSFGIFDALDEMPLHQRGDGAADGRFVGSGAIGDVLRAAGFVAKAEVASTRHSGISSP